ncbi:MAG: hypothetical protein OXG05_00330 [Gammaproteobacteria bacterium]|nr:hypothetical protein [Gammaproteobacteria bacterium]
MQSQSKRAQVRQSVHRVFRESSLISALIVGIFLDGVPAVGGETDPYTHREIDIGDSLEILDTRVNDALNRIASNWSRGCNERAFIFAVYRDLGGRHWVDKIERWAMFETEIDRLPHDRANSVFADAPILVSTGARLGNFSRTINVNGVYISTDKLGHFFSQGRKFYTRYQRLGSVAEAAKLTARWEGLIWGNVLSGIYSNADLVANYEGFLFYRSLFNDDVIGDQASIFQCNEGALDKRREFTWADHINSFWDEMLNPSYFRQALVPAIERRMLQLCADFALRPERYRMENPGKLYDRYQTLALRDSSVQPISHFLDANCK